MPIRASARIERAPRSAIGQAATLRERAKFASDILVEDLSRTGCRISSDAVIVVGTLVSIGIPGLGMQAARVVRSNEEGAGCEFLLPLSDEDVERAQSAETVVSVSFPQMRERIRAEADIAYGRRSTDGPGKTGFWQTLTGLFR